MQDFLTNPKNKQRILYGVLALVIGIGGYTIYDRIAHKVTTEKVIPLVRTVTVGETADNAASFYPGEVRGRYESQLAFQVTGKISARLVNVGDRVQAGQILLTLDPKDISQNVEAASAQLASAKANQKLAADNAARYNALYAQGAVSEAIRDQYNTQLEAANASLRQAQAQSNISGNQLGYTQLISDADGVVAAISGETGQIAAAGAPMATVIRNGEREVQIYVPEGTPIQLNQQASISLWALPNARISGYVREIAPMADPVTRTYKVCVAVPNLPSDAKLGMTAKVGLLNKTESETTNTGEHFILPAAALYQVNNKPQVWLVRDKHAQLTDVTVGGYDGNKIIITQGLTKGDKVITAGLAKLTPNQEVKLEEGGEQ